MIGWRLAVSVGSAVPRHGFEGTVHSVFHRAANLHVSGDIPLVTLLCSDEADLPQGIRLDVSGGSVFESLSVGDRAVCKDGLLVVGNALRVDLYVSGIWECDLASLTVDMTDAAVVAAWDHAWLTLQERQARSLSRTVPATGADRMPTHESILSQRLERAERALLGATIHYDIGGMSVLGNLVGFGTGLTPSGDDFLTGYLAGLWCATRHLPQRRAFLSAVAQLVAKHSTRTNDIARTYLRLAARGQVSRRLVDLARAIGSGADSNAVVSSAQAAMQLGHSSGMETVKGLLLGLAAWDRPVMVLST